MQLTTALARISSWVHKHPAHPDEPKARAALQAFAVALSTGQDRVPTPRRNSTIPPPPAPSGDMAPCATLGEQVTSDPHTQRTWAAAMFLARRSEPVLILGESGTGKESIARALHGDKSADRFVAVNCGAIPEGLVESILFGHKRGAFTGATTDHTGAFERANGGTLFLDEVGDLPLMAQTKILRAIQESTIMPVGHTKTIPFQARVVAATHKFDGASSPRDGFRLDLYHRLAVHVLHTKPLRSRVCDIPLIAARMTHLAFSPGAMQKLCTYSYHGNIRELKNVVTRSEVNAQIRGEFIISTRDVSFVGAGITDDVDAIIDLDDEDEYMSTGDLIAHVAP